MGISIIYDTQLNSAVDKRLKQNATMRFECEKLPDKFRYWELDVKKTEENIQTGRRRIIPLEYMKEHVFPYYNTYKVSPPLGFDKWLTECNL